MAVAGIYFGNTNSVVSVCIDGRIETVSNETGFRITPTIVAYTGSEKIVGQPAKQYMLRNPLSCISSMKKCVGQKLTDEHIEGMKHCFSCKVSNDNGNIRYNVKVDEKVLPVSIIESASYIFTKLLEIAELVGGEDLENAVLAVPSDFSDEQILALREAAEVVGWNIIGVISEPAAALLAYGVSQKDPVESTVLVYRLGGSSMDATLMETRNGIYRCVGQKFNRNFGANHFNEGLIKHMADEFKKKYKEDISDNKRAINKLKVAVEDCKHGLSQMESNTCAVESLFDGLDITKQIPRAKFEALCGNLFQKCMDLVNDLLQYCKTTKNNIDKVILIGGGVRMPKLVKLFKDNFPKSELLNNILPDEAISNGAALQAGLLNGKDSQSNLSTVAHLDCTTKNLGIKVIENNKEKIEVIIPKFTPIPCRRIKNFKASSSQTTVCLTLYEFDQQDQSKSVCQIALRNLPEDEHEKELVLTLEFDRNGELTVSLNEKKSNTIEKLTVQNVT